MSGKMVPMEDFNSAMGTWYAATVSVHLFRPSSGALANCGYLWTLQQLYTMSFVLFGYFFSLAHPTLCPSNPPPYLSWPKSDDEFLEKDYLKATKIMHYLFIQVRHVKAT